MRGAVVEPDEADTTSEPVLDGDFEPTPLSATRARLGRYELIYEIGAGGMASVYLARATGPAGFRKWFAIKQIHPHLAKDRRFVEMFLDEARIAAALQHPNVAQVFELGSDDGAHFLAMEYLHGEHLGSVGVRAARAQGHLPFALAARVISAAADGLDHAHEAVDAEGHALSLVHRDVSPQNIFVTYDGQVKITDFGIAKAANRITKTRTGSLKGKYSYMAPEQALGADVDRRTDIFALGIVLWEITTGRRLFKAETEVQTLMRITSGKVRPPSHVAPDYPPDLEVIVMRALARRPSDRYPTAAALARELDRFIASLGAPAGNSELAAFMQHLFPDRHAAREEMLRNVPEPTHGPLPAVDVEAEAESADLPAEPSHSEVVTVVPRMVPRRRRPLVAAVAVTVVAAAAVTWLAWPAPGATVRIDTEPSGARVELDDHPVAGTTPVLLEQVERDVPHRLTVSLDGQVVLHETFTADRDRVNLSYTLAPVPTASSPQVLGTSDGEPAAEPAEPVEDGSGQAAEAESEEPPGDAEGEAVAAAADSAGEAAGERRPEDPAARGTAYLNLITRPWARVWINGRPAGQTPLFRVPIPAGRVAVRVQARGEGDSRTIRLSAAAGQTVSRSLDL